MTQISPSPAAHQAERRFLLKALGVAVAAGLSGCSRWLPESEAAEAAAETTYRLPIGNGERPLVAYPQKRPLILHTSRPPQLETPLPVFNEAPLTPNDAFFVRYHHANTPLAVDLDNFRVKVHGQVEQALSLSLLDLKTQFPSTDIVAVNQCSGNSRGFVTPRVSGGQLGHGAMGNARWTGVPLKAVLERAGLRNDAVQIVFNGLDQPVLNGATPDFAKALSVEHALDGEVMLAWAMNGEDLPMLNGYPLRLVVPGYYGTYWVKHLNDIQVVDKIYDGFFMSAAYRLPDNDCNCVWPGTGSSRTVPIGRYRLRSLITSVEDGAMLRANQPVTLRGLAFDGGAGIREIAVSTDGGWSWQRATLLPEMGRYGFRHWEALIRLPEGNHVLMARAISRNGEVQPMSASWNPAGYQRNVVERVKVIAT